MKDQIIKLVAWNIAIKDKNALFRKISSLMFESGITKHKNTLVESLEERELAGSTMADNLIAIPHIQSDYINKNTLILVRTIKPINNWDQGYDAQFFLFCCIRSDISVVTAKNITRTIKLLVSNKAKEAFSENNKEKIIKILKF